MIDLIHSLTQKDHHEAVARNRRKLQWLSGRISNGDTVGGDTMAVILEFDKKFGRTPDLQAMVDFIQTSKYQPERLLMEADLLEKYDYPYEIEDIDLLIDKVLAEQRKEFHLWLGKKYGWISNGGEVKVKDKGKMLPLPGTPELAVQFIRNEWAKRDFLDDAPALSGPLHENTEHILAGLEDKLKPEDDDRIRTGFSHIDTCQILGRKRVKFIGILGMSGDGKSLFLHSLIYNMARDSKNILHVSLEYAPEEIWEFMAFLHSSYFEKGFTLPSLHDWEQKRVTAKDIENMNRVIEDIKSRRGLPGLIDVQQLFDWDSIIGYLTAHQAKNKYDVLVIDYLARLNTSGDARFRDTEIKKIIHDAQVLTHKFDSGRGIVVITPMQVNREANKAAKKAKVGEKHYDLNSISNFSEYQQDMDLILGVYSDEQMKEDHCILVEGIKAKKGKLPPDVELKVQRSSKHVREYFTPAAEKKIPDIVDPVTQSILTPEELQAAFTPVVVEDINVQ